MPFVVVVVVSYGAGTLWVLVQCVGLSECHSLSLSLERVLPGPLGLPQHDQPQGESGGQRVRAAPRHQTGHQESRGSHQESGSEESLSDELPWLDGLREELCGKIH